MRGGIPKSAAEHKARGNPRQRSPAVLAKLAGGATRLQVLTADPDLVACLTVEQREIFDRVLRDTPPGLLKRADGELAVEYCVAKSALRELSGKLAGQDVVLPTGKINPAWCEYRLMSALVNRLAESLGLTPSGRARLLAAITDADRAPDGPSPWDSFIGNGKS